MRSLVLPVAACLYGAAAVSVGPVLAKHLLTHVGPFPCILCFTSLAALSLACILALQGQLPSVRGANFAPAVRLGLFFIFFQALPGIVWFHTLPSLSGMFAMLVKRLQPLVVLLLSVPLVGRRFKLTDVFITVAAVWGMHMLLVDSAVPQFGIFTSGPLLAVFVCIVCWALQFIYARRVFGPFSPFQANAIGMTVYAAVMVIPAANNGLEKVVSLDGRELLVLLFMGIGVFGLGVAGIFKALKHLEAWTVTMIMLAGPLFGAAAAYLILGERLSLLQAGGAVLVVITMGVAVTIEAREGSARG